ncbi:glycoside hydrolase family 16 protein [Cucurbitaria berberidis CBS 394.84]|uniref:Glycoside hydrolase family 16 protein n=1 Tax=Cucurbitaria berberidis CBS 394.84 TaxID=1168544 RepID=A0A9P4GPS8_9PLEO|nr:glycoside hydrolase family 16 protein [Cucurbitaria berberidis CBS 394.84]KAF1850443.1 glycoside hydrolase family 16 protein [Cucurbitaria berberidis CBS 394.84]
MAAPLKRTASYTSSRYSGTNAAGHVEQFGRSTSSLFAEKEAAFLRGPGSEGTNQYARAPDRESDDSASSGSDLVIDFGLAHPTPQLTSPFSPTVSSPLNPTASASSWRPITTGERRSQPRPLRPSLRGTHNKSAPDLPSQAGRLPGSSLTLQDLGTDYTRYFSPYSDSPRTLSARSSFCEHSSASRHPLVSGTMTPLPANPFLTPNASTTKLNTLFDPEKNTSFIDDRLTAPYGDKGMAAWPLIGDEVESDDELHMPHPDDDIHYRPKLRDHFTKDSIVSTIGLFFMIAGLLFVFIGLPVLSAVGIIDYNSSYGGPSIPSRYKPQPWAKVNDKTYPLLLNMRKGLIDPDTPQHVMKRKGAHGDQYELVFSDEFNKSNRTFYEGDDPYFFAGDFWYGATKDLQWYDPDAVTTHDGVLEIKLEKFINHGLEYRSGMLNSWNQLCFKGGIFEVSVSLPGPAGVTGLWPGAWTMGNLGRPGYLSTTDGMWPYTYQACDAGITPNQSSPDGLSNLPGQRLPSCTCPGEDHPTPGTGRGAPEIDVIEVGATYAPQKMPIATQSYQVAPFDIFWYPNYNFTAFPDHRLSYFNSYTGGPFQQAISATTNLNKDWFDGVQYQRYSFEYAPGEGENAFIDWKVGDQTMFTLDGRAIGPNGNIKARQISEEPMSMILNLGISNGWTWIDWEHLIFPAVMRVDYVRLYQKTGEEMVTCDPPGFETTKYIKRHQNAYSNQNLTVSTYRLGNFNLLLMWTQRWDQTGHSWPKHKLNSDC